MKMEILNLDKEYERDVEEGRGFILDDTNSIIKDERNAPKEEYSAIVKPTDSASIDVAIP